MKYYHHAEHAHGERGKNEVDDKIGIDSRLDNEAENWIITFWVIGHLTVSAHDLHRRFLSQSHFSLPVRGGFLLAYFSHQVTTESHTLIHFKRVSGKYPAYNTYHMMPLVSLPGLPHNFS